MLLYLRHGDDRGTCTYRNDRRLNHRGKACASEVVPILAERYGHPDMVVVSPFRRAIETLEAMAPRFTRAVKMHRDPRIAAYVSAKTDPAITPETASSVTITEDKKGFRARIKEHAASMHGRHVAGETVWCITHQAVIEELARHFGVKIRGALDFLDPVVVLR